MDGRGPALGVLDDAVYPEARLQLAGDDRLLLFSDGLVERRAVRARPAASTSCSEAVAAGPAEPQALLDAVLAALNPPGTDDVTLLGVART